MQCRTGRALEAMIRPEDLRTAIQINSVEWALSLVIAGKRNVLRGVPVLGGDNQAEPSGEHQRLQRLYEPITFLDRQGAAGHKIGLEIYNDQSRGSANQATMTMDHEVIVTFADGTTHHLYQLQCVGGCSVVRPLGVLAISSTGTVKNASLRSWEW